MQYIQTVKDILDETRIEDTISAKQITELIKMLVKNLGVNLDHRPEGEVLRMLHTYLKPKVFRSIDQLLQQISHWVVRAKRHFIFASTARWVAGQGKRVRDTICDENRSCDSRGKRKLDKDENSISTTGSTKVDCTAPKRDTPSLTTPKGTPTCVECRSHTCDTSDLLMLQRYDHSRSSQNHTVSATLVIEDHVLTVNVLFDTGALQGNYLSKDVADWLRQHGATSKDVASRICSAFNDCQLTNNLFTCHLLFDCRDTV